ncbi:ABC transporter permease [Lysinibacillus fusiformis]|uniref:ABC transporter permease n=1 Tax=Lysinibacillus fusiformis TaxID=28031 RepID=A0A2I0UY14_9BACI|nr:ABC transporter permease [Lysinibacillus fusiformis]PKU50961.1 ABC transporter permease [Lysinibacillus fusiformis]
MLKQQIGVEFKQILTFNRVLTWFLIIILPVWIQYLIIHEGYYFTDNIDLYGRLLNGIGAMIFPILVLFVFADTIIHERNNNYLTYTKIRIDFNIYLNAKIIVNALLSFGVSFLYAFLPFLFAQYINPQFAFITNIGDSGNMPGTVTFDQLLVYGPFMYGFIYSLWVGINGVLYATLPLILCLILDNSFVALSIPFVWYQAMSFVSAVLGISKFAPLYTVFPYSIMQQDLWTVFVPFMFLLIIVIVSYVYLKRRNSTEWLF